MDVISYMPSLRLFLFLGALGFLLVLEWKVPFRVPVQSRLRHIGTNLTIGGSNAVVVMLSAGPLLTWSHFVETKAWGLLYQLPGPIPNLVGSVVLLDLVFYGAHWANHHVPFLWRFHRAHHSDLDFDVTTALRFHLGEIVISTVIKAVSIVALGISPLGLILFEMAILAAAQFEHSNLRLPEPIETWVRLLMVTPNMHRIHHSRRPREHNANFGTIFSGWDRLFGTYFIRIRQEEIRIGLDEYPSPKHVGLVGFSTMPFGAACQPGPNGP